MAWGLPKISAVFTAPSGNLTATEPAGIAVGDLMICCIAYRDTAAFTLPTGGEWAWCVTQQSSGNTSTTASTSIGSGAMAWCRRGASPPNLVFTRTGGDIAVGKILAYSGGLTSGNALIAGSANTEASNNSTPSTPELNTTGFPNALLVAAFAGADNVTGSGFSIEAANDPTVGSGSAPDTTNAPDGQWRLRYDEISGTGADTANDAADAVKTTAGATGAIRCNAAGVGVSSRHVMMAAAFRAASAAVAIGQASESDTPHSPRRVKGKTAGQATSTGTAFDADPVQTQALVLGQALTTGTAQAIRPRRTHVISLAGPLLAPDVSGSWVLDTPILPPPTILIIGDSIVDITPWSEDLALTDQALSLDFIRNVSIGLAEVATVAQVATLRRIKRLNTFLGFSTEVAGAGAAVRAVRTRAIGQAQSTALAQHALVKREYFFGVTAESDVSFSARVVRRRSVQVATEVDLPFPAAPLTVRTTGQAQEADSAGTGRAVSVGRAGQAQEADAATAAAHARGRAIGLASAVNTATQSGKAKARSIGISTGAQIARDVSALVGKGISRAETSETSFAVQPRRTRAVSIALEGNASLAVTPARQRLIGLPGTGVTAPVLRPVKSRTLSLVSGIASATVTGKAKVRSIGLAAPPESEALEVIVGREGRIQAALESDAALRLGAKGPISTPVETDVALPARPVRPRLIGLTFENDTAANVGETRYEMPEDRMVYTDGKSTMVEAA